MDQLQRIRTNVDKGAYHNEYSFELDVQRLVFSVHDRHFVLYAGIIAPFTFASPYEIVSASIDGKSPPGIYLKNHIVRSQKEGWTPSEITKINGAPVIQYLTELAANESFGNLEAHADGNQLMGSPANIIKGDTGLFTGGSTGLTFYPGNDLVFTFANGTTLPSKYIAYYTNPYPTGPLTTGGDFYNYFVLDHLPAACDGTAKQPLSCTDDFVQLTAGASTPAPSTTKGLSGPIMQGLSGAPPTASPTSVSWYHISSGAYPDDPFVKQSDLSITGTGMVTGYYMNDMSTAVLSLPTFVEYGQGVANYSRTVTDFITGAKQRNAKKIIIDLQQNDGGVVGLAIVVFKKFFPRLNPLLASNRRDHPQADRLGSILTGWLDSLTKVQRDQYYQLAADEWIVTDRLNAETDEDFTSWAEFYGPRSAQGDLFSLPERYNLSDLLFEYAAFSLDQSDYNDVMSTATPNPFDAKDIILLTDGLCSSACSLFVEMMTYHAGVRTIVVGGRPDTGPMQAVSGSRGAYAYSGDQLDHDIELAQSSVVNNATANATLPHLIDGYRDSGVFQFVTGVTLRNQLRKNDTTPLQFKYLAADCRIFFTISNVWNFTRLWYDAAEAMWTDSSRCVPGSLGYTNTVNRAQLKAPPAAPASQTNSNDIPFNHGKTLRWGVGDGGKEDFTGSARGRARINIDGSSLALCESNAKCDLLGEMYCRSTRITCSGASPEAPMHRKIVNACLQTCVYPDSICPGGFKCDGLFPIVSKSLGVQSNNTQLVGFCFPLVNFVAPPTTCAI